MRPLLFHVSSSRLDLCPDLIEYVKVGLHFLREKIEFAVAFSGWSNEIVLLQSPDVVLCDPIVNVEGLSELIDVSRLFSEKVDDLAAIRSPA
jgi:hypothetical protein